MTNNRVPWWRWFLLPAAIPGGIALAWRRLPFFAKTILCLIVLWLTVSFMIWDFLNLAFFLMLGTIIGTASTLHSCDEEDWED